MRFHREDPLPAAYPYFITEVREDGGFTISNLWGTTKSFPAKLADMALTAIPGTTYSLVTPARLIHAGDGPRKWKWHKYHGRKYKGTYATNPGAHDRALTVYPLAQYATSPTDLIPFFTAIVELGVPPSSLGRMVRRSWQRLIPHGYTIWSPPEVNPAIGRAFTGGRRESVGARGTYVGPLDYMDMPAAYLSAMRGPFPTRLEEAPPALYDTGIGEAIVHVPEHKGWMPLPLTKVIEDINLTSFVTGVVHGAWTMQELRAAEDFGYEVIVTRAWRGIDHEPFFDRWLNWAYQLRTLPGASGVLAKTFTNRLWGQFGLNARGRRTIISWDEEGGQLPSQSLPKIASRPETKFVSAMVAANTRLALFRALTAAAVWCDTDGVIAESGLSSSLQAQGWKRKDRYARFQMWDWAHVRYKCMRGIGEHQGMDGCPKCEGAQWHYRCDGVTPDSEDAQRAWNLKVPGEFWNTDPEGITLPSMPVRDFLHATPTVVECDRIPIGGGI